MEKTQPVSSSSLPESQISRRLSAQASRSSFSRVECSAQARATCSRHLSALASYHRSRVQRLLASKKRRLLGLLSTWACRAKPTPEQHLSSQRSLPAKHCMHPETNSSRSRSPQAAALQRSTPQDPSAPPMHKAEGMLYRVISWKPGFRGYPSL